MRNLEKLAYNWVKAKLEDIDLKSEYYCRTRDVFEARNDKIPEALIAKGMAEDIAYLIYSILGELGNNSFDHNLANWPNILGVFFGVDYNGEQGAAVVADRGLGVLSTLRRAAPDLKNDEDALSLAFTKKISSRVLENRGNGLKFVKNNVIEKNMFLKFHSGAGLLSINHNIKIEHTDNRVDGCLAVLYFKNEN